MRVLISSTAILILLSGAAPVPRFTDITVASGAAGAWVVCGIGAADIDNDGFIDFCTSAVNGGSTRVYRNNGNGTFSDIANSGIGGESQAVTFGDVDNDGLVDVWVGWYWTNSRMFKGNGTLNPPFDDITGSSGTGVGATWEGGAFADVDNDGNLDLFVTRDGQCRLYMGNGAGGFVDQGPARGVGGGTSNRAFAYGDVDADGDPDLIIGIGIEFHFLRNDGSGNFTDETAAAGLTSITVPGAAAQVAQFADIDNDGDLDVYLAGWGHSYLLTNNGAGVFTDISVSSGIRPLAGSATYSGMFGVAFGDYDNDGFQDLFLGGGEIGGGAIQNLLFHNNGNNTFTEVGVAEGVADVQRVHVGAVFFDLENDGDLDLFVGADGTNLVLRNETDDNNWLKVRVQGTVSNRSGIGAKIWVYDAGHLNDPAHLRGFREVTGGSGQASCPPFEQHFGVPGAGMVDVRVRFPSGNIMDRLGETAHQILTVVESVSPVVTAVNSPLANGTYGRGAVIPITVTFSTAVDVTGTPTLTLETGASDAVVPYLGSGSGVTDLIFFYQVASGHMSPDLDVVSAAALGLNGGTIKNHVGGASAVLTLPAPGAPGSLGANKDLVVHAPPGIAVGGCGATGLELLLILLAFRACRRRR
jgi:enediyne biosynthesis protein E4